MGAHWMDMAAPAITLDREARCQPNQGCQTEGPGCQLPGRTSGLPSCTCSDVGPPPSPTTREFEAGHRQVKGGASVPGGLTQRSQDERRRWRHTRPRTVHHTCISNTHPARHASLPCRQAPCSTDWQVSATDSASTVPLRRQGSLDSTACSTTAKRARLDDSAASARCTPATAAAAAPTAAAASLLPAAAAAAAAVELPPFSAEELAVLEAMLLPRRCAASCQFKADAANCVSPPPHRGASPGADKAAGTPSGTPLSAGTPPL